MSTKKKPFEFDYPKCDRYDDGCKVCWRIYKDGKDARRAAQIARKEARHKELRGYDFGYQSPGTITTLSDGSFSVCCP